MAFRPTRANRSSLRRSRETPFGVPEQIRLPKLRATLLPIGHDARHQLLKFGAVTTYDQVAKLVDHDVFQAFERVQGQTDVDANAPSRRLATPPSAAHVAIRQLSRLYPQYGFPSLHERRDESLDVLAPLFHLVGSRRFRLRHGRCQRLGNGAIDPCALLADERCDFVVGAVEIPSRNRDLHTTIGRLHPHAHVLHPRLADDPDFQVIDEYESLKGAVRHVTSHVWPDRTPRCGKCRTLRRERGR